jgi:multiple sugar transport system substrate-binding protein
MTISAASAIIQTFERLAAVSFPSVKAVLEKPEFQALPQRTNLMDVTKIGTGLPSKVERQFAIQDIIGEELAAAITGAKDIDSALADAESRVNEMLANL